MKKTVRLSALVMALLMLTACGASSQATSAASYFSKSAADTAYAEVAYDNGYYAPQSGAYNYETADSSFKQQDTFNDSARKLIKKYNISTETEHFDDFLNAIQTRVNDLGGYIEALNTYNGSAYYNGRVNRTSTLTARIPSVNLENFVNFIGDSANITSKNLGVSDVTTEYVDTESRKATYEIEMERLLAMLEKCETVDDMIAIESRLSEVRYNLEAMERQLRTYDNLVDYSTVYLDISEVTKYTEPDPVTYGDRIANSFKAGWADFADSFQDFTVDFLYALPKLILWGGIIAAAVVIIVKKSNKKKAKRVAESEANALAKMNQAMDTANRKANN